MPARGAGEASETGREQRLAQPRATDHFDRHGVIRGIQRGTAARNASYSLPNVRSSVGSSYATTKTWKASQQQRAVDDEAPIAHQHRLTQDDGNDRDVYWITHITVETGHHEIPGRRDGRGGAETLQRETRKCVNEPRHACENHYRADAARQLQTKERRPELPTRDRPWNEPRQRTWGDHEENRRAQDGNGSLHGGSRHSLRAHSNLPFMVSRRHPGANYLAFVQLASIRLWLRVNESAP